MPSRFTPTSLRTPARLGGLALACLLAGTVDAAPPSQPSQPSNGARARGADATRGVVGPIGTATAGRTRAPRPAPVFTEVIGDHEFSAELIVRPLQDLTAAERRAALAAMKAYAPRRNARTDEFTLAVGGAPLAPGAAEHEVSARLLATGLFQYACPNWTVYPCDTPDDLRFAEQWHHATMQSALAWDLHRADGAEEVIVAVTDTGIIAHEDLGNRVPGFNSASDVAELDGGDLTDIHGHGTHVAGCAAAAANNGAGVAGMGWNLRIMPIRVSEAANGGASYEDLLEGVQWAAENGAKVVSTSYSGIGFEPIETTGEYVRSLGASMLWAAGNSATDHAGWDFEHVLVVGASGSNDLRASFSSYGRGVDLFAPGVSILSSTRDGGYGFASGTSMATPVANGALALVRSANPALSAEHAEHVLLFSCDPWGAQVNDEEFGFGRINLRRAVERAQTALVPQDPVPADDFARAIAGAGARIAVLANDWDANMDAIEIVSFDATTDAGRAVTRDSADPSILVVEDVGSDAGPQTFRYTVLQPEANALAEATVTIDVRTPIAGESPTGLVPGLVARYYELPPLEVLPDFTTIDPYLEEVVASVDFASTDGAFAGSGRADQVGAVFTGWLEVPEPGFWTLATSSDDGSRLFLGETLVVDNDGLHGMVTRSTTVALGAGFHRVRLEFFENGGGAGLLLRWAGPSTSSQSVPAARLFHVGDAEPADLNADGLVNSQDLAILLGSWGVDGATADLDGDGQVNAADLAILLERWTN
jgi:hypothetical protein